MTTTAAPKKKKRVNESIRTWRLTDRICYVLMWVAIRATFLPQAPAAMALGAIGDEMLCEEVGATVARGLRSLGINWNFAPVLDVNNNPVAVPDPTKVTTTLTDDNTAVLSFTAGADSLHWTGACTNGTTNVTAGLTFNDGSFGPFAASCAVTVALPTPPPPSPTDLNIIFTAA